MRIQNCKSLDITIRLQIENYVEIWNKSEINVKKMYTYCFIIFVVQMYINVNGNQRGITL